MDTYLYGYDTVQVGSRKEARAIDGYSFLCMTILAGYLQSGEE